MEVNVLQDMIVAKPLIYIFKAYHRFSAKKDSRRNNLIFAAYLRPAVGILRSMLHLLSYYYFSYFRGLKVLCQSKPGFSGNQAKGAMKRNVGYHSFLYGV